MKAMNEISELDRGYLSALLWIKSLPEVQALLRGSGGQGKREGLTWPEKMTPELLFILGQPNFTLNGLAQLFRETEDRTIPTHAEEEQANVIFRMVPFALKYGKDWKKYFGEYLKPLIEKSEVAQASAAKSKEWK